MESKRKSLAATFRTLVTRIRITKLNRGQKYVRAAVKQVKIGG